jgi:hypothetical protein
MPINIADTKSSKSSSIEPAMHPSRSPTLYHYKVGISTEELTVALKQKIQEVLALGYDICTDFVINPRTERKDIPHEYDGKTVLCINNQGNFAIDHGVMNLMVRGKDLEGKQRFFPADEESSRWCGEEGVEATDYIVAPLFFPASDLQRAHLIADDDDPDQLVELYAIPSTIFYPDENKFLSWVLHVDCKDEAFIRGCVEPLVTSHVVKVDGRTFPGPLYVQQRDETFNVYFDRSTYDAARVVTVFSVVWRDNVTFLNAKGEEYKKSVAVNFRAQRVSAERFHLNEMRSAVGFEPPKRKNAPKTRVESSWGAESDSAPKIEQPPVVRTKTPPLPVEEPKKKYVGRYAGLFTGEE